VRAWNRTLDASPESGHGDGLFGMGAGTWHIGPDEAALPPILKRAVVKAFRQSSNNHPI
jgi:hypothetical protein